jgi:hypothetical protein
MIKLLPNKEFVVDILEEIIEYKEDDKTVCNYLIANAHYLVNYLKLNTWLVLVEQAKRDLKDIVKIWGNLGI